MGIAAYNRGTASIARGIQMDYGTWREPAKATPRPAGWGDKTKARALDHAERMLRTNRKLVAQLGPEAWKPITLEVLAGAVEMRTRCSLATATEAARLAMGVEVEPVVKTRIAEPVPTRFRVAAVERPVDVADLDVDEDTAEIEGRLRRLLVRGTS